MSFPPDCSKCAEQLRSERQRSAGASGDSEKFATIDHSLAMRPLFSCAGPHPRALSPDARRSRYALGLAGYEDLNATIGSTREARRAGTSAATSATAISNTAMAM